MKIVLASYNILHGHHSNLIIKNIKFLIAKDANVICLQETDLLFKKSLNNLLKKELRDWKVRYFHTGIACNLAIVWNDRLLKLKNIRPILLPTLPKPSITQRLLRSTQLYKRGALSAHFLVNGKAVRVTNAHLGWEGGIKHRMRQLRYLREFLNKEQVDHGILSGDFNTFAPAMFRRIQKKKVEQILGKEWINALPDLKWSCDISYVVPQDGWGKAVKLCRLLHIKMRSLLDYMFIYNMKIISAEMFDLPGSDHRPQLGRFELN